MWVFLFFFSFFTLSNKRIRKIEHQFVHQEVKRNKIVCTMYISFSPSVDNYIHGNTLDNMQKCVIFTSSSDSLPNNDWTQDSGLSTDILPSADWISFISCSSSCTMIKLHSLGKIVEHLEIRERTWWLKPERNFYQFKFRLVDQFPVVFILAIPLFEKNAGHFLSFLKSIKSCRQMRKPTS